ncbi:MAG: pilus assembly protein [Candidatus Sulfotelmatobacter sp.]|nr:pilus assembly protein [Candidatus Sulfotelmatobacter sp.]
MKWARRALRRLAHGTRGTELAEAAVVLPLLFLALMAIYWFGQAFRIYGTITHAAREGARAAVAPICATCTGANDPSQNAYNAIKNALMAANLDPNQLQKPTAPLTWASCSGAGTVTCDGNQGQICVQGITHNGATVVEGYVQLTPTGTGGAGACGVSVSFQYPYSLSLPGSPLGGKKIYLRAQAQMRAESQ